MTEDDALDRMVPPSKIRPLDWFGGTMQIWVTRRCDRACTNCTQGSNLRGATEVMPVALFEKAVVSLKDYFGVVGLFGGNPAITKEFPEYCEILREHVPYQRRGLWCNRPFGHGKLMRETFNPRVSNLNVHQSQEAYDEFKRDWPECQPFGLTSDSRHSPVFVAMKDVIDDEEKRWELIAGCDINQRWSAMIGLFRGELRGWFCEIAGSQAMLHQQETDYPDTGSRVEPGWWDRPMAEFAHQVRKHCHECGVPLRGYGALANDPIGVEQCSQTHGQVYQLKLKSKLLQVVENAEQVEQGALSEFTQYVPNAAKKR
ncbi:MAG: hypothetical protein NXI32_09270 [bacterium]|nr:hypothetical protein [bacterium]